MRGGKFLIPLIPLEVEEEPAFSSGVRLKSKRCKYSLRVLVLEITLGL